MLLIIALTSLLSIQQVEHADKKCVVTQMTVGGLHTDCAGWQAPPTEKILMPAVVIGHLKSGDTLYFVWRAGSWEASVKPVDVQCELTGLVPRNLVCNDPQKTEFSYQPHEWPSVWGAPQLTARYSMTVDVNGHWLAVAGVQVRKADLGNTEGLPYSDFHRERFQRQPLQCSGDFNHTVVCKP